MVYLAASVKPLNGDTCLTAIIAIDRQQNCLYIMLLSQLELLDLHAASHFRF